MEIINVHTKNSYNIFLHPNVCDTFCFKDFFNQIHSPCVVLTEKIFYHLYKQASLFDGRYDLIVFEAGESQKTRETKQWLEDQLFEKGYSKDVCLIAVGGGVVTDVVGFLASTFCRGVPCIYVPTTLLAMVDASLGGKTGVNTPLGKNMVGSFYQPQAVFIDPLLTETLTSEEFLNGFAEVVKHAIIADREFFFELMTNINHLRHLNFLSSFIKKSLHIKKKVIEADETEQNLRCVLNFGHTVAHALEAVSGYAIKHGFAVAIGILCESYLSYLLNYLSWSEFCLIENGLKLYSLLFQTNLPLESEKIIIAMKQDKKNSRNRISFVLITEIGSVLNLNNSFKHEVQEDKIKECLEWVCSRLKNV